MSLTLPKVGRSPGWRLELGDTVLDERRHHAIVEVALADGLGLPPVFRLSITPITKREFEAVAAFAQHGELAAELRLSWRDAPASDAPSASPAAFRLRIRDVRLEHGQHFFNLVVRAWGDEYAALADARPVFADRSLADALVAIAEAAGVELAHDARLAVERIDREAQAREPQRQGEASKPERESTLFGSGHDEHALAALTRMDDVLQRLSGKRGRPLVGLRAGKLVVGPERYRPQTPRPLSTERDGLLQVSLRSGSDVSSSGAITGGARREIYDVVLHGRPELWPADFVSVPEPHELPEVGRGASVRSLFSLGQGALQGASEPIALCIESLRHTYSREEGFVTRLIATRVRQDDLHHDEGDPDRDLTQRALGGKQRLVTALKEQVAQRLSTTLASLAEVRAVVSAAQVSHLARGLVRRGGRRGESRTADISDTAARRDNVPYATPFAWGRYGMVVPRYPGTRVVVVNRGTGDDPIDVGAVWRADGPPPASEPGDWWLTLPADVPVQERKERRQLNRPAHVGLASNDLIDADGNRSVEARSLTCVAGDGALRQAGERPLTPSSSGEGRRFSRETALRLVHAKNGQEVLLEEDGSLSLLGPEKGGDRSRITIDADGNIGVSTKGDLTIDANNVQVNVAGTMNVSKKQGP